MLRHDHAFSCGVEIDGNLRVTQVWVAVEMQGQEGYDFPFDDSLQWTRAEARVKANLGHVVHEIIGVDESDVPLHHSFARVEGG